MLGTASEEVYEHSCACRREMVDPRLRVLILAEPALQWLGSARSVAPATMHKMVWQADVGARDGRYSLSI